MSKLIISDQKALLNIPRIHDFLSQHTTWAKGIPLAVVEKSITNSLCFGVYAGDKQVGFCRVITDYATFGNLVDVIVWPEYRGQGISKLLMQAVMGHEELSGLRRFTLATADAHGLYAQFGFTPLHKPDSFMECYAPNIYCDN